MVAFRKDDALKSRFLDKSQHILEQFLVRKIAKCQQPCTVDIQSCLADLGHPIRPKMMSEKSAGKLGAQCCNCGLIRAGSAGAGAAATAETGARDTAEAHTEPSPALRFCTPFCGAAVSPATIPAQDCGISVPELRTHCEL